MLQPFQTFPTRARFVALAVLLASLVVTAVAVTATRRAQLAEASAHFEGHAERLGAEVQLRINRAASGLRGTRAAYVAYARPWSRAQFRDFITARNLGAEFPGVRGFGLIQRVERGGLAQFVADEQRDDAPDFQV